MPRSAKLAYDHRSEEGLNLIRQYIEKWAGGHGRYPSTSQVSRKGSVGSQDGGLYWPSNPWDHAAMAQRDDRGSFTYRVSTDHSSYTLRLHRALKVDYVLSGAIAARQSTLWQMAASLPLWLPVTRLLSHVPYPDHAP
jgi:hypothetical protein